MNQLFHKQTVDLTSYSLNHGACHPCRSPFFCAKPEPKAALTKMNAMLESQAEQIHNINARGTKVDGGPRLVASPE